MVPSALPMPSIFGCSRTREFISLKEVNSSGLDLSDIGIKLHVKCLVIARAYVTFAVEL